MRFSAISRSLQKYPKFAPNVGSQPLCATLTPASAPSRYALSPLRSDLFSIANEISETGSGMFISMVSVVST